MPQNFCWQLNLSCSQKSGLFGVTANYIIYVRDTLQRSWLRYYATNRKVVGSIPDEGIGFFFNLPNSSCRNMALGPTQPLTKMSTRNFPGGKGVDA
jgi:hypothetical protein